VSSLYAMRSSHSHPKGFWPNIASGAYVTPAKEAVREPVRIKVISALRSLSSGTAMAAPNCLRAAPLRCDEENDRIGV